MFDIDSRINSLEEAIKRMEDYLLLRFDLRDWHGIADAAMDIRELDAQIKVLKELKGSP